MTNAHLLGAGEPHRYYDKPAGFYYENGWKLVFGGNEKDDGFLLLEGLESIGAIPAATVLSLGMLPITRFFFSTPGMAPAIIWSL